MAKVRIGGEDYTIPEMNFLAVERAWPFIEEAMISQHPMKGPSAALRIVAAGLMEKEDFDPLKFGFPEDGDKDDEDLIFSSVTRFLKKQLKAKEIVEARKAVEQIIEEAGLQPAEGEEGAVPGLETTSHSTETAVDTSQSSLPQDAKEEAGTA